jgi:hypothetical protein
MKVMKPIIGVLLIAVLSLSACMSTHYLAPPEKSEFLTLGKVYIVLDDGSEVRLNRCVLEEDLLVGFTRDNQRVEVELSRIRAAYYKKIKPTMPYLAAFSAGTVGISIWLIVATFTAPSQSP